MRYLVLSDIHANLEALDACLADARARGFEQTLVLGDLVGYGADPNAVIDRILALAPTAVVRGNHDKVASGLERADGFNAVAKSAVRWTLDSLTPEHRAWLAALPPGPKLIDDLVEICHGTPFDEDAYIFDESDALRAIHSSSRPLCLFGHTHCAVAFQLTDHLFEVDESFGKDDSQLHLESGVKYLVNPGSVGQPRDGDPRAAYAIADTTSRTVELHRLAYDMRRAQAKIVAVGLPDVLARRLAAGR
jgi:predicted phosphodiesterase